MSPTELSPEVREIQEHALVVLMHTELVADVAERRSAGERAVLKTSHLSRFRQGAINCICNYVLGDTFQTNRFPSVALLHGYHPPRAYAPTQVKHALAVLGQVLEDVAESAPEWTAATEAEGIESAASSGTIAMVLAARGATFLEEQPLLLSIFHQLGLRALSLVSDRSNAAASAAGDDERGGLTKLGTSIVREAHRLRMAIDVAGLSPRAFWQVAELIDGPFVISLGNVSRLCAHPANLGDDQIKAVAERGGVIGVHAEPTALSQSRATVSAFVDHVEHIAQQAGVDSVGIGLNVTESSMIPMDTYARLFPKDAAMFAAREMTQGLSAHSDLLNVTAELYRRRYSPDDIRKILGLNALRAYGAIWGESAAAVVA